MAVAVACWLSTAESKVPSGSSAAIEVGSTETTEIVLVTVPETPPPALDPLQRHPIPKRNGVALDELYPSLRDWNHPVVTTNLRLPVLPEASFGAERVGVRRHECGRGHCGVDITGPIGRPIVAVADGVVTHVDRSRLGKDRRSGRFVRIQHDDGTFTAYMHLDSIARGLERGDRVLGGEKIGTLGATAIRSAPPHLHFALEMPGKVRRDHTRHVDPAPFLARAHVLEAAEGPRDPQRSTHRGPGV